MRRSIVSVVAVLLAAGGAQAAPWSFDVSPIPHPDSLSPAELRLLDGAGPLGAGMADRCAAVADTYFGFYLARYPDFAALGEAGAQAWRQAAFARGIPMLADCVLYVPMREAFAQLSALGPDLLYCGQVARTPQALPEQRLIAAVSEMQAYAGSGHPIALVNLLALNGIAPAVSLTPDLEYFLRRALARDGVENPEVWDVSHLGAIAPARRAELDAAVDGHDLSAALSGTLACAAR